MSDSPPGISAAPNEENLRHFDVSVSGPESSPYEGMSSQISKQCEAVWLIKQEVYSNLNYTYPRNTQ